MTKTTTMTETPLKLPSAFSLFTPSIEVLKRNLSTFIQLILVGIGGVALYVGIMLALLALGSGTTASIIRIAVGIAGAIAVAALVTITNAALTVVQARGATGEQIDFKAATKEGQRFAWRFLGLTICVTLVLVLGIVLFIIPFFFMLRRYILATYYLVDRDLGVFEAMKQSAAESKQYSGAVWGLIGVSFLISLPNWVPLVGWITTVVLNILYFCAPAVRYRQITEALQSTK